MRGLKELRVKESDRLAATAAVLRRNGVEVEIEGDDLIVHGTEAARPAAARSRPTWITASPWRPGDGIGERDSRSRSTMPRFIATSFPGFVRADARAGRGRPRCHAVHSEAWRPDSLPSTASPVASDALRRGWTARRSTAGTRLDIAVFGGSALMLASNFRFSTEDVGHRRDRTAVADWLTETVERIAERNGWPDNG